MPLTYFPVTGVFKAATSDTSDDVGGDPDIQYISCTIYFTPSTTQAYSSTDKITYRLGKLKARTNPDDGALKTIDGNPVTLPANTADLNIEELTYRVDFTNVVYSVEAEEQPALESFRFAAPTDNTAVDLAEVEHI